MDSDFENGMMRAMKMLRGVAPLFCLALWSCHMKPVPQYLMPTPQLFVDGKVKPFVHLPAQAKSTELDVFYATNRKPLAALYGNGLGPELRFGKARVGMGGETETWDSLVKASTTHPRNSPIEIRLIGADEMATDEDSQQVKQWARGLDDALRKTETKDLVIYVHGAKVGFLHSCAFAAELDHFAGRDFTPIAFDWPTHQEIFSYVDRTDLRHAKHSAARMAEMLRVLAEETSAERIHIVSWSAGARVLSRAMEELGGGDAAQFRKRYRIGTVVFAAGDVPEKDFIGRLPAIHGLSDRVLVYVSDDDFALRWASRLMGGGQRLGLAPKNLSEADLRVLREMRRLEVIDTSYGKDLRGFDITGHRYWFQHPWVNSDLLLALRTSAAPAERGLKAAPVPGIWYFGADYPKEISSVGLKLTTADW